MTAATENAQPTHFVVELPTSDGVHYVICEHVTSAPAGGGSLPTATLEQLLNSNPLRAAAIPAASSAAPHPVWLAAAMVGQSGTGDG